MERHAATVSGIMSTMEFASLELTAHTQEAIREMGFVHMTEVQARTIPHLLTGRDVLGAAKTGAASCCVSLTCVTLSTALPKTGWARNQVSVSAYSYQHVVNTSSETAEKAD